MLTINAEQLHIFKHRRRCGETRLDCEMKPFFPFFFSFLFFFFFFWLAQQNCEWEMCHGSRYLCSIDEVLNIFEIETRSNPLSPVEWSLQEGLPGSAPRKKC